MWMFTCIFSNVLFRVSTNEIKNYMCSLQWKSETTEDFFSYEDPGNASNRNEREQ